MLFDYFAICCIIEKVRVFVFDKTHINALVYKTSDYIEKNVYFIIIKMNL